VFLIALIFVIMLYAEWWDGVLHIGKIMMYPLRPKLHVVLTFLDTSILLCT
jgi:hypothetical protein